MIHLDGYGWHMNIDIKYVCTHAGERDRWYDEHMRAHSYIPFTLMHARKIFRLIKQYGDDGIILNTALYIKRYSQETGNKRILEQWVKA